MKPITITGYGPSVECMGCDKPDQQCMLLETEAYTGWHCAKCTIRETKKRAASKQPEHGQPTT